MPPPLTRRKEDGDLYRRPTPIEAIIDQLMTMAGDEALERCRIEDRRHPSYVPSEVLLHLLRQTRMDNNDRRFETYFRILFARVNGTLNAALPDRRYRNSAEMRDEVSSGLARDIALDRAKPDSRLDFFECHFDQALASRRITVLRKMGPKSDRTVPLTNEASDLEIAPEVEKAAQQLLSSQSSLLDDPAFRLRLSAAIDSLPDDERTVIALLQQGVAIDSKEQNVVTIARMLGCNERTVRNRRDRGLVKLKAILKEEFEL